jgi:hypothetical protein
MTINWLSGFFVPLIEITFIFGIVGWISFIVIKAFRNAWLKSGKFFWKHKIMRKPYPEKTLLWCMNCMDQGVGWYDAKKFLMIKMVPENQVNETMWIFDQIILEMKGGLSKDGRQFKGGHSKTESTANAELTEYK